METLNRVGNTISSFETFNNGLIYCHLGGRKLQTKRSVDPAKGTVTQGDTHADGKIQDIFP